MLPVPRGQQGHPQVAPQGTPGHPVASQASGGGAMSHGHSPMGSSGGASWGRGTPPAAMSPGAGVMSPPQMGAPGNPNHQVLNCTRHLLFTISLKI